MVQPIGQVQAPHGCSRGNRHSASEKRSILNAWEEDERALQRADDGGMSGGEHAHLHRVQKALDRLQSQQRAALG
jgi:hypothetical protein